MNRKEMIRLLETHSGTKAKYMGAPSFEYQITIRGETYRIAKDGVLKDEAGNEVDFEAVLQLTVEEMPEDNLITGESQETVLVEISVPMEGHTGQTLRNIVNMVYSKQEHLKKAFGIETDIVSAEFVEAVNAEDVKTLEQFKEFAERIGTGKCPGISFDFEEDTIVFKFGIRSEETEKVDAATKLVSLLNKSAKEQKHTSFKPSAEDNMKFTMRVWLIRLGFVGDEYKDARKTLLKPLEGNSAFRKGKGARECIGA